MTDTVTRNGDADLLGARSAARFIWYELMTADQDQAIRFYKDVVGWTAADQDVGGMRYSIFSAGGRQIGGCLQLTDRMCEGGARPGWVGYLGVEDTDAKAAQVEAAGGRLLMPPGDIPGIGRFAMVTDPGGAAFYLMTPLPPEEGSDLPDPDAEGSVNWHELYSAIGQEAAFDFYARLFGWETVEEMDMGPMGRYRIFAADGLPLGGMMDRPEQMPASTWGFYVKVDAIDAAIGRIEAGGGTILMGPHQVPGDSWIVQALDPQGVAFALTADRR